MVVSIAFFSSLSYEARRRTFARPGVHAVAAQGGVSLISPFAELLHGLEYKPLLRRAV